jgi:hypothetical protein
MSKELIKLVVADPELGQLVWSAFKNYRDKINSLFPAVNGSGQLSLF